MGLSPLNNVSDAEAYRSLVRCCGAEKWVDAMLKARPYTSMDDLYDKAEKFMDQLSEEDWREAFTHHPKIGDLHVLRQKFNTTATWEAGEQSSVATATDDLLRELQEYNIRYEDKFGYIFIICATGRSADSMLDQLKLRLPNDKEKELAIAANEQKKITLLRLEKLCQ